MKNIGIIVIVIVVLGLGYYMFKGDKASPLAENPETASEEPVLAVPFGSGKFTADSNASILRWTGKKTLVPGWEDSGTIKLISGDVSVSDGILVESTFVIDMGSIEAETTGMGKNESMLTTHLKSADFFDVEKYPTSQFSITGILPTEDVAGYLVSGNLTLKGKTNPIIFPITIVEDGSSIRMSGVSVVDRTQFDVRFGSGKFFQNLGDALIDDEFTLKLDIVGTILEENLE
ncbi:MAG: lipid-binding protein [Candidatus Vogelbacteria bacterium CG10_big_fil_rev_8_21_14_0_10_45_14]|uniref:Lipid-binding protein n=1 Tax=Candidatus Vogelbacteria bacterium CG10_big_fil_rev_8_21_14_0_10_45_14 TaxID=1975042 RepID=A0A2H0RJG6_9BACT|nr:MAG: lipid-binding protein [Candidatus Vogelbacteria bacterium CG10_big_fil_rev_8_21_14_0_10_45_14]